jgi:hypothetical protein
MREMLLDGQCSWQYFSQGNANVLLQSPSFPDKLLRLRKSSSLSCQAVFEYYQSHIRPRFGEYCANMQLVQLGPGFVNSVQQILPRDVQITDTDYGILVQHIGYLPYQLIGERSIKLKDSTIHERVYPDMVSTMVEFKPKWLLPAPNSRSSLCRTCALSVARKGKVPSFCRLDLVSSDETVVLNSVKCLVHDSDLPLAEIICHFLRQSSVLRLLQDVQRLDHKGILGYALNESLDDDFLLAMTCRDCTLFLEIIHADDRQRVVALGQSSYTLIEVDGAAYAVRAKLADMDAKSRQKRSYWENIERSLSTMESLSSCGSARRDKEH